MNFVSYTQIQTIVNKLLDCITNSMAEELSDEELASIIDMLREDPT